MTLKSFQQLRKFYRAQNFRLINLGIASGRTAAQVSALADLADEYMAKKDMVLRRTEGQREGRWAVLDYGSIMVHLFHREERAYYGLDRLWNDGSNALDLPFDQTIPD